MIVAIPLGMMMEILAAMSKRNDLGALGLAEGGPGQKFLKKDLTF